MLRCAVWTSACRVLVLLRAASSHTTLILTLACGCLVSLQQTHRCTRRSTTPRSPPWCAPSGPCWASSRPRTPPNSCRFASARDLRLLRLCVCRVCPPLRVCAAAAVLPVRVVPSLLSLCCVAHPALTRLSSAVCSSRGRGRGCRARWAATACSSTSSSRRTRRRRTWFAPEFASPMLLAAHVARLVVGRLRACAGVFCCCGVQSLPTSETWYVIHCSPVSRIVVSLPSP